MKPNYRSVDPTGLDVRGVVNVLVGQIKRDDLAAVGVDGYVQFAPSAALCGSMFLKQPFARAVQLQPRAVDDQVKVACFRSAVALNWQPASSSTQRRMIGDGQIDIQHSHGRADQPFALAERQSKYRS
jgi:hypothetical protein